MMKKETGRPEEEGTVRSRTASLFPHLPVSFILFTAAFLRLQGLSWGLPCARHWFSYHPDEALVIRAAANVNLFAGHLDPGFYNYGSFLIYCISLVSQILDAWSPLRSLPNEMARMTLVGRWEVALFGVATVYMAYLIGHRVAGHRAGLLSAAVLAVIPMHAVHAHFVTVDVPAAFWVSAALYNALRWPSERRAALWCGLAAGLAAGTKYNAGIVLFAGWAAAFLAPGIPSVKRWRAAAVMTGATIVAFLASTPGVLLNQAAFLRDFSYEVNHVRTGHGLVFVNTGPGWWYHLSTNLWQGIGAFLPAAVLVAVVLHRFTQRNGQTLEGTPERGASPVLVLCAFAVPYFALISAAAVRFQRYDMPLLPILAVGAGAAFAPLRRGARVIPAAALLGTLFLAQAAVSPMSDPGGWQEGSGYTFDKDPRDAVADWFDRGIPASATIGLTREPWFFSPPFSVANGGPQTIDLFQRKRPNQRHRVQILLPNADAFSPKPDFVVISDYEYGDALRLQGAQAPERMAHLRPVMINPSSPPDAQRIARLWNALMTQYDLVGLWSPRLRSIGVSWPKRALPPHDSFYAYPTIIVFQRAKEKT